MVVPSGNLRFAEGGTIAPAVDGQAVARAFHLRAQFAQLGFHRLDPVGFLVPQPRRIAKYRRALGIKPQHRQDRRKVRTVRYVDALSGQVCGQYFGGAFRPAGLRAEGCQNRENRLVALQGIPTQIGKANPAAQRGKHRKERRLRIIALHNGVPRLITLPAGDDQRIFAVKSSFHAELPQCIQRQIHIAARLKGRQYLDAGILGQQRQRKQQSRDELGADIAVEHDLSAVQRSLHGDAAVLPLKPQPLLCKQRLVDRLRALHQPSMPRQVNGIAPQCRQRDQKPQRRAGFTAVDGGFGQIEQRAAAAGNRAAIAAADNLRAQRLQCAAGRGHVLGGGDTGDARRSLRQPCTEQRAVRQRLGWRHAHRAGADRGINFDFHAALLSVTARGR